LDLSIASGIQQMLLPRQTPRIAGLEFDARYKPAQRVGGDLYDFFELSETRLGVLVADVSGKGISASLLMAICRTNLRQIAPRYDSPSRVLIELNAALSSEIQSGLYVTMIYAIVDMAAHQVTLARAGHELPLFVRRVPDQGITRAEFVGTDGMALGMVENEIFSRTVVDHSESLRPGDLLVLYTDGLTEAPNEQDKEFSGARLADVVRSHSGRTAREINDSILEAVQRFTGELPQRDDFTLVTVRRTST
jgi:phosphoserine phosphatase RsbU/P